VAGIGNIFFGDDGFGPAVIQQLLALPRPDPVDVADYGIAGVHLAYDLLDGRYDTLILVDAVPLQDKPGTLAVIEIDDPHIFGEAIDAHAMSPAAVLAAISSVGATMPRVVLVGCQPAQLDQGMELSAPVATALGEATRLVSEIMRNDPAMREGQVGGRDTASVAEAV
jgi:hydrogenase maturation protease